MEEVSIHAPIGRNPGGLFVDLVFGEPIGECIQNLDPPGCEEDVIGCGRGPEDVRLSDSEHRSVLHDHQIEFGEMPSSISKIRRIVGPSTESRDSK